LTNASPYTPSGQGAQDTEKAEKVDAHFLVQGGKLRHSACQQRLATRLPTRRKLRELGPFEARWEAWISARNSVKDHHGGAPAPHVNENKNVKPRADGFRGALITSGLASNMRWGTRGPLVAHGAWDVWNQHRSQFLSQWVLARMAHFVSMFLDHFSGGKSHRPHGRPRGRRNSGGWHRLNGDTPAVRYETPQIQS